MYFKLDGFIHNLVFDDVSRFSFFEEIGRFSGKITNLFYQLSKRGSLGIILFGVALCFILLYLILPIFISSAFLMGIIIFFNQGAKCRNLNILITLNIIVSLIYFWVSNEYKIESIFDVLELIFYIIIGFFIGWTIDKTPFCENCSINYDSSEFYINSNFHPNEFVTNAIHVCGLEEKRYSKEEILELQEPKNIFKVKLFGCKKCDSKIISAESKSVNLNSKGSKKLKDEETITELLIIS
jgi:hypothetical protein